MDLNGLLELKMKRTNSLESICTVKTKKSNLYFSFHFYKINILKLNISSQEDLKVETTIQLINKIDPVKHVSRNFEKTYTDGIGTGYSEFIVFQVINLHFFQDDSFNKMN